MSAMGQNGRTLASAVQKWSLGAIQANGVHVAHKAITAWSQEPHSFDDTFVGFLKRVNY